MGLFDFLKKKPPVQIQEEVVTATPALTAAEKAEAHLREGNLGGYAMDLLAQTKEFCKNGDYQSALRISILRFCVDTAGIYDLPYFASCKEDINYTKGQYKPIPVIVPHTMRTISQAIKKMGIDDDSFRELFFSIVTDDQIPCGFCTAKEAYAILIQALNDQAAADATLKRYVRRFVRREGL